MRPTPLPVTCETLEAPAGADSTTISSVIRALHDKNYLFIGDDGGRAACTWYTIIQSARINHVHVLPYLNDVLVRIPAIVPEYLRFGDAKTPFEALTGQ